MTKTEIRKIVRRYRQLKVRLLGKYDNIIWNAITGERYSIGYASRTDAETIKAACSRLTVRDEEIKTKFREVEAKLIDLSDSIHDTVGKGLYLDSGLVKSYNDAWIKIKTINEMWN